MKKEQTQIEVKDGDDLSSSCIKCGRQDVVQTEWVDVEHAPFWAKWFMATGFLSFVYNRVVQRASLHIGFCKKHSPSPIMKRLVAYGILLLACTTLGLGLLEANAILIVLGFALLVSFLMAIRAGTSLRVNDIKEGTILLPGNYHIREKTE